MRSWTIPLIAAAFTGCAGQRPEAPPIAHEALPDYWSSKDSGGQNIVSQWWRTFQDPSLDDLVEIALRSNIDLAIGATRVDEALAQFEATAAHARGDVSWAARGARMRSVSPFGEPEVQTAGTLQIQAVYEVDLFGRLRLGRRAAASELTATRWQQEDARLKVAVAVTAGYVQLRSLDSRAQLLDATRRSRDTSLRLAQRRFETGYGTMLEARQAEAELHATEQLIPAAQLAIARQEHALSLLLGATPQSIHRGIPLEQWAPPEVAAGIPASLLHRRADILRAEAHLLAADHRLDAARAAFLPNLRLSADGGVVDSTLLSAPIGVFTVGAALLGPILDGGKRQAQQHAAASRRDQAALEYRQTVLQAVREVEDALVAVQSTRSQRDLLLKQRVAVAAVRDVAARRFREGYSPYLEQIDAERNLLAVDLALVQARDEQWLAIIALTHALGGGVVDDLNIPRK